MSIIRIVQPEFAYNTDTETFLVTFNEQCPPEYPDPAGWHPTWKYELILPVPNSMVSLLESVP